jgi:paraquat-inducible protein A
MTEQIAESGATIACRRCGQAYQHVRRRIFSGCPYCGASAVPLRHRLRHNGLAALLAIAAMIVLVLGMVMPFISMTKLGTSRIYSLIGGIVELFNTGNNFIAAVLLLFSVVFPILKLVLLITATSSLVTMSDHSRRRMHAFAMITGKYSLLDLLVVAVMIVLVKFGDFAQVRAEPGTILFCVAVFLSMAAGFCVDLKMTETAQPTSLPRSRPYLRLLWLIPGLAMLGVGLFYHYNVEEGGEVNAIKLTTKSGMVGQAAEAVANLKLSTPDLYVMFYTSAGETRLPTFKNTPVGNGLTWNLPQTVALRDVQRVEVWDHHAITKDQQLDRITMGGWSDEGQLFHVDLHGQRNEPPKWAIPLAAAGGAVTLLGLLKFVWDQVI